MNYEDYFIYVLEDLIGSQPEGTIIIDLIDAGTNYSFEVTQKRLSQSLELIEFLRIYALLQFKHE